MGDPERPQVEDVYGRHYRPEVYDPTAQAIGARGIWLLIVVVTVVLTALWAGTTLMSRKITAPVSGYDGHQDAYRPR